MQSNTYSTVTVHPEYRADIFVIRVNGQIIDTLSDFSRAASLANRLAGALGTSVNA